MLFFWKVLEFMKKKFEIYYEICHRCLSVVSKGGPCVLTQSPSPLGAPLIHYINVSMFHRGKLLKRFLLVIFNYKKPVQKKKKIMALNTFRMLVSKTDTNPVFDAHSPATGTRDSRVTRHPAAIIVRLRSFWLVLAPNRIFESTNKSLEKWFRQPVSFRRQRPTVEFVILEKSVFNRAHYPSFWNQCMDIKCNRCELNI